MPIHLFLAHFPVALLVVGAAADVLGAATRSEPTRRAAGWLLILGSLAALLAFVSGDGALLRVLARMPPGDPRIEAHTQWGGAGVWVLAVAGVLRALWRDRLTGAHAWATLAAGIASAALVLAIAASGTAISHG